MLLNTESTDIVEYCTIGRRLPKPPTESKKSRCPTALVGAALARHCEPDVDDLRGLDHVLPPSHDVTSAQGDLPARAKYSRTDVGGRPRICPSTNPFPPLNPYWSMCSKVDV